VKNLADCTILVVDDTEENIDILVDALGDDYELIVATDGTSALELMKSEKPDLILLDIMMPGLSGYEVCYRLKKDPKTEDIPIIFLTAISDIQSKTKVSERTNELFLTQETTIEAMAFISEYRDPETGGHIKRTKNYVRSLAEKMQRLPKYQDQLSDEMISQLYNSAPLHDIGKVGIRDEILLKQGKLTKEEFDEMKTHAMIGFSALKLASLRLGNNSFLKYAMELARHHHERWDGTGYPDGLSGEGIPLSARIMAVADVYDALISARTYKPAFPHEKSISIIKEERGTHLDPTIVDIFLADSEEFRKIAVEYADFQE
jgi:putative two-component system response regulator